MINVEEIARISNAILANRIEMSKVDHTIRVLGGSGLHWGLVEDDPLTAMSNGGIRKFPDLISAALAQSPDALKTLRAFHQSLLDRGSSLHAELAVAIAR